MLISLTQLLTKHAGVGSGVSQMGIQHLGILNPNNVQSTNNLNANAADTAMDVTTDSPSAPNAAASSISPRAMSIVEESKAPKAVVSDGEEDSDADGDGEEDENGTNKSDEGEEEPVPLPPSKVLYSPRTRQFMT